MRTLRQYVDEQEVLNRVNAYGTPEGVQKAWDTRGRKGVMPKVTPTHKAFADVVRNHPMIHPSFDRHYSRTGARSDARNNAIDKKAGAFDDAADRFSKGEPRPEDYDKAQTALLHLVRSGQATDEHRTLLRMVTKNR